MRWRTISPTSFRTLALPGEIAAWSLTSLREKVVKIGAKIVAHGRYLVFQMAEVAVPRELGASSIGSPGCAHPSWSDVDPSRTPASAVAVPTCARGTPGDRRQRARAASERCVGGLSDADSERGGQKMLARSLPRWLWNARKGLPIWEMSEYLPPAVSASGLFVIVALGAPLSAHGARHSDLRPRNGVLNRSSLVAGHHTHPPGCPRGPAGRLVQRVQRPSMGMRVYLLLVALAGCTSNAVAARGGRRAAVASF